MATSLRPTRFHDQAGREAQFYIQNNPWKANSTYKVYRHCIACGDSRFTEIAWKSLSPTSFALLDQPAFICDKPSCVQKMAYHEVMPRQHLFVELRADRVKTERDPCGEFVEESIPSLNVLPDDRVYRGLLPVENRPTWEQLERYPVGARIEMIDLVRKAYTQENGEQLSDPFLRQLNEYRTKCVAIWAKINECRRKQDRLSRL